MQILRRLLAPQNDESAWVFPQPLKPGATSRSRRYSNVTGIVTHYTSGQAMPEVSMKPGLLRGGPVAAGPSGEIDGVPHLSCSLLLRPLTPCPFPQRAEGRGIFLAKRDLLELTHSLAPLGERGGGEGAIRNILPPIRGPEIAGVAHAPLVLYTVSAMDSGVIEI